jgi:hypothetical protein
VNRFAFVALVLLVSCAEEGSEGDTRGVRPGTLVPTATHGAFVREQSAALFVGVREFAAAPSLTGVRYTVDDAVDLAYVFALERKVSLVDARRVALALTGEPRKADSQERLKKLRAAGAIVTTATLHDVLTLLERQAHAAGRDGLLILGFASHGFSRDGVPYVLTSTSQYENTVNSLSAAKVFDIADRSKARRSLIFIDACRERVAGARGPHTPTPLVPFMKGKYGQVVFYAAAPGSFAYEDAGNGVFTKTIIEGLLSCSPRTVQGVVTVEKLSRFVEDRVLAWTRRNRDRSVLKATQVSMDADTKLMPLASCVAAPPPATVTFAGTTLTAFGVDKKELWRRTLDGLITRAEVADVDDDGINEVLATVGHKLIAIDALASDYWAVDTKGPVRQLIVERLFSEKRKRQLIAVSDSAFSIIDYDGTLLGMYPYSGRLQEIRVGQLTARHDRKIIVTADGGRVFMVDPDRKPKADVWAGLVTPPLTKLDVIDFNNDGHRDIELTTGKGRVYLDFDGKVLKSPGPYFQLLAPKRR